MLSETFHESLKDYTNLYSVIRLGQDGVSIVCLVKIPRQLTAEDESNAAELVRRLQEEIDMETTKLDPETEVRREKIKEAFRVCFQNAGMPSIYMEEIPNEYWGGRDAFGYASPWFMVTTPLRHFRIGWRKRVIEIEWSKTTLKVDGNALFKDKNVTTGSTLVHAWSYDDATEYLRLLKGSAT